MISTDLHLKIEQQKAIAEQTQRDRAYEAFSHGKISESLMRIICALDTNPELSQTLRDAIDYNIDPRSVEQFIYRILHQIKH